MELLQSKISFGAYWLPVICAIAAWSILLFTWFINYKAKMEDRLRTLEVKIELFEHQQEKNEEKLDKIIDKLNHIEIQLQNKANK